MKIRPKITLFTTSFLILMVIVLTFMSVRTIRNQGDELLSNYKAEEVQTVKEKLKDLVDVAYETIDKNFRNLSDREYLGRYYETRLHDIINTGETIIKRYKKQAERGELSLNAAKRQAMQEIKQLRFDGGTGYIWINDVGKPYPRMIMHPTVPRLDGEILRDQAYNNALGIGKNLFVAFVDITEGGNDGYVNYLWPKPTSTGLTEEAPKLSYVRRYEDWGWILGTGIYIDDARRDIENRIKESIKSMRYAGGTGYFWINDNTTPFPKMVMHPTVPELDGEELNNPSYNNAQGIGKNLFVAFNEVTSDGDEEGYVDYLWPKPIEGGLTEERDKTSYVRLHKELGWIIGSGAYIDTIDETVAAKKEEIESQIFSLILNSVLASLVFILLAFFVSNAFSKTIAKPIERLSLVADDISRGRNLDAQIHEVNRKDEIGELAKSVDRLKNSVKIMLDRMTKK